MGADARAAHKTGSVALAMRMLVIQALALHVVWAQNSGSGSTCVWSGPGCPASMSFLYPGTTRCFAKKWVAPRCDFGSTKDALHPACTVTCPLPSSCAGVAPYTNWSDQRSDPQHGNTCFKPGGPGKGGGDWQCPVGCKKVSRAPWCGEANDDTKPCRVAEKVAGDLPAS